MPYNNRYPGGPEDYYQQSGSNFNPYTGRLDGGNMVLEFLARLAGQKEQKKQAEWDIEDRDVKNDYLRAQSENLRETKPTPQQKMTSFQEWMNLGKELGIDPKDWALEFKRADPLTPEQRKANATATTEGVIAGGGTVGGGANNAAWKDEATNLGKLMTAKISNLDKEIERYNGYAKKADEEIKKYGSAKNRMAMQKSSEARKAMADAKKSIRSLELYKKQMMAHQTNISPNKPVDETTRSAIVSEYPKTISDILYGGQDLDIDTSGSNAAPRFIEVGGQEVELRFDGKYWTSKDGKIKAEDRNGQLFPVK